MARLQKKSSFKPYKPGGVRDKAERFVVLRGKGVVKGGPPVLISKAEMYRRTKGAHPVILSAQRKAGTPAYKGAAAEKQAKGQIKQRTSNREQLALPQYGRTPTHAIVYINTAGVVMYDYFWNENLRRMHAYRDAVAHARSTGDGRGLYKFKRMVIKTYDGPGLRGYDNKNTRIHPETSLRKILKAEGQMSALQKAAYFADVNYRHIAEAA